MNFSIMKKPSAWVPIIMPLTVLGIMLICFAIFGVPARQTDRAFGHADDAAYGPDSPRPEGKRSHRV